MLAITPQLRPLPRLPAMPGKSSPDMARMDTQMKAMRQMHDKMMAAKSPDERNALMAEHRLIWC